MDAHTPSVSRCQRLQPSTICVLFYVILTSLLLTPAVLSAPPPVLDNLVLTVFTDPPTDVAARRHFRYLSTDSLNQSILYAGAVNHVYILQLSNISRNAVKSVDLSQVSIAAGTIQHNVRNCLAQGKDAVFSCQNHVRAVIRVQDRLFVCTTGSHSPAVYYLHGQSLSALSFEARAGRAICPYDPSSNYTVLYVERGNPENIASIYSGTSTDFTNTDPVIYRPPLFRRPDESSHIPDYRLLRTEQDSRWLNDPQFVSSFDVGDFVYFFFREHSLEHANCGRVIYSRVARLCKSDEGGSSLSMDYRWTSFLKARLNCSLPGLDAPYYFNQLYDVQYNSTSQIFFGLFRTMHGGFWGSAVCTFSLATIDYVFSRSPFKFQRTFESNWRPVPDHELPRPRPGQCDGRSVDIGTSSLAFIKSHMLMEYAVDSLDGVPIYYTKHDLAATRLAVTHTARYTVLFIGSSRGVVYKVAQWRSGSGRIHFVTVAVLRPFRYVVQPIWQMILHTTSVDDVTHEYLYLGTDDALVQLRVDDCQRYSHCSSCARDPHCGWSIARHACLPYQPSSGLVRKVSSSAQNACIRRCRRYSQVDGQAVTTTSSELLHGSALSLSCPVSPVGCATDDRSTTEATWYVDSPSSRGMTPVRPRDADVDSDYLQTRHNELVVLSAEGRHSGTYTCLVDGRTIARHHVRVLPCKLQTDNEAWKLEFAKWCAAFHAFKREYRHWLCLKKQCIEDNCIPVSVMDKCRNFT